MSGQHTLKQIAWAACLFVSVIDSSIADEPMATPSASTAQSIERLVSAAIQQGDLPGAVVVAATSQQIVFAKAYGDRQVAPTVEAMTLETHFDLASLTKPIATATSVFLLVDAGQLGVNDFVVTHLPEFGQHGKNKIRLRHLLLHTSGLTPDNALADYQDGPETSWERICDLELRSAPGEKFAYSDVGFMVLQKIVEAKSTVSIDDFTRLQIFAPLGMSATGYRPLPPTTDDDTASRIVPTHERARGEVHDPRAHALGGVAGHAGLFSKASDLIVFGRMMLRRGRLRGGDEWDPDDRLLSEKTWSQMVEAHEIGRGTRTMGWDHQSPYSSNRGTNLSKTAFGHGGFTGTVLWIDPANDFVFVFLSNRLHPDGDGSVNRLAGDVCTRILAFWRSQKDGSLADQPNGTDQPSDTRDPHNREPSDREPSDLAPSR